MTSLNYLHNFMQHLGHFRNSFLLFYDFRLENVYEIRTEDIFCELSGHNLLMQKNITKFDFMLKVCSGKDSNPSIPNAPVGQIAGWIAEYSSGKVYLCGGQDSSVHKVCA